MVPRQVVPVGGVLFIGGKDLGYNHKEIEKKWQNYWADNKTFKTSDNLGQKKFYALDMFPYPSGAGLHVGHPEGYTLLILYLDINVCKVIMYYIQWDGMLLDYLSTICIRYW